MSIERLARTRDLSTKDEKGMNKERGTRAGARSRIEDVRGGSISFEMDRDLARPFEAYSRTFRGARRGSRGFECRGRVMRNRCG